MPSASLAVVRRAHPDMVRVTALSAAITLNLVALLFAMRPLAPQVADALETVKTETVRIIEPPPKVPPPPDIVVKALPKPTPVVHVPVVQIKHVDNPVVTAPPTTEPSPNSKPVTTTPPTIAPPTVAPGVVSLAYRSSPLRFPVQAVRQHMSGTVLLRVLVDENGKPLEVQIEHSSGHTLLDQSARAQVLASWQFQPAEIDGHSVRAWARVPVNFALQEL
jgi:periplasmic protein TonB